MNLSMVYQGECRQLLFLRAEKKIPEWNKRTEFHVLTIVFNQESHKVGTEHRTRLKLEKAKTNQEELCVEDTFAVPACCLWASHHQNLLHSLNLLFQFSNLLPSIAFLLPKTNNNFSIFSYFYRFNYSALQQLSLM